MVSKKAVAALLLLYVMSVLAEQAEGFVPFFTQSDFQKMQEKERNKGYKKSVTPPQQLEEGGFSEQSGADINGMKTIQLAVPVRAGTWLILRQLEKYQGVLEKLLTEVLQDTPNGTGRGLISALGILPFSPLTSSSSWRYLYSSEGLLCHVCSLYTVLMSSPSLMYTLFFWEGYMLSRSAVCVLGMMLTVRSIATVSSSTASYLPTPPPQKSLRCNFQHSL
uniref:Motilin/ghrelin domain-containing protein n=1 Tax=Pavo cristatus TaxID=9049 RepID=A0A8C9EYM2_PAVCR